jgi:hypothetical protein
LAFGVNFTSSLIRIRIRNADPDPGEKSNADPCGSGTLAALERNYIAGLVASYSSLQLHSSLVASYSSLQLHSSLVASYGSLQLHSSLVASYSSL